MSSLDKHPLSGTDRLLLLVVVVAASGLLYLLSPILTPDRKSVV